MLQTKARPSTRQPQPEENPTIYVRNCAKRAIMLTLPRFSNINLIKEKVFRKMKVQPEDQAFFLNGNLVSQKDMEIQLQNRNIFHLINLKKVHQNSITVKVRKVKEGSQVFKFVVNSCQKIQEFMNNKLADIYQNIQDYFIVYTGRELQMDHSFQEEYVEDFSELLCVHRIENLKETKQQTKEKPVPPQNETQDILITNRQKYSVISSNNYGTENVNFKKKRREIVEVEIPSPELSENYYSEDSQSKNYLPFSIISSRHEEEQSIDCERKKSIKSENSQILSSDLKYFHKQKSEGEGKTENMINEIEDKKDESLEMMEKREVEGEEKQEGKGEPNYLNLNSSLKVKPNAQIRIINVFNPHQLQDQEQILDIEEGDQSQHASDPQQKQNIKRLQMKKKISRKSSDNSESLLIDDSQDFEEESTGKFKSMSPSLKSKSGRFSSILNYNSNGILNNKLSYTFGDSQSQLLLRNGSAIYVADQTSQKNKNILDSILKDYDQKYGEK